MHKFILGYSTKGVVQKCGKHIIVCIGNMFSHSWPRTQKNNQIGIHACNAGSRGCAPLTFLHQCGRNFDTLFLADLQSNDTLSQLAWETQAVSTSETFRLENFTYSNDVIRDAIFGHLQQTDFTGVSVSEFLVHYVIVYKTPLTPVAMCKCIDYVCFQCGSTLVHHKPQETPLVLPTYAKKPHNV